MGECMIIYPKQDQPLDSSVKQRALTFFDSLTKDDTSPGLHIEPVKNSADPRARTGRVDLQYRALLFKLTGDVTAYVVHGIYNHDEAYEKASKVKLSLNPINGLPDFQQVSAPQKSIVYVPVAGEESGPKPFLSFSAEDLTVSLGIPPIVAEQAIKFTTKESLEAYAESLPEWQGCALALVAEGESFSVIAEELSLMLATPASPEEAMSSFDDPAPATDQALLESFDAPAAQMGYAKISGSDELRRIIGGGNFAAWRVFLHPQQRRWAQSDWKGPYRLGGGAGTGKTVVVLHRACRLARENPEAPIVVTTFTTNLASELAAGIKDLDPSVQIAGELGQAGVFARGIDAVASAVIKSAGSDIGVAVASVLGVGRTDVQGRAGADQWKHALQVAGFELPENLRRTAFVQAEYEMIVLPQRITTEAEYLKAARPGRGVRLARAARKALWEVFAAYRSAGSQRGVIDFAEAASIAAAHLESLPSRPARHVLVDEGQDFKPCHWQLVRALVADSGNDIFIVEDPHQRIYGQRVQLSRFGIQTRGRSRNLRLNYRTTAQNLAWAVGVLKNVTVVDSDGEKDSTDGYLSARSGPVPVIKACADAGAELDYAAKLVTSWLADTEHPESIGILVRDRASRERVVSGLAERGVTVRALDAGAVKPGAPVALTMHRAKGTEFAKVLLFGVSEKSIPMGVKDYDYNPDDHGEALLRERSLLYVAASRARDELAISFSGPPSPLMPG